MAEDYELQRLNQALARSRAIGEAEEHVMLEQMADQSPDTSWPPAPNTAHPWMEQYARIARQMMDEHDRYAFVLAVRQPLRFTADPYPVTADAAGSQLMMNVRKARGLAPYVGTPFVYEWRVAVDKYQRWVAGDSTPVYREVSRG
jgi:hypothetical protein